MGQESERRRRFDVLFASYSSDIVSYCGWRAGSTGDAQDAAADVFLTAWRRLDEVPESDAARLWLYATARRLIANQRRSSRRRVPLQEQLAFEAATVPLEPAPLGREETLVHCEGQIRAPGLASRTRSRPSPRWCVPRS